MMTGEMIEEAAGFYSVIPLKKFRDTPGVIFDRFPLERLAHIDSVERVLHENNAVSPGPVDGVARPWYMHPFQDDNLIVLHGTRHVDLYETEHGKLEHFVVTPNAVYRNDELLYQGGALLVWPRGVFHRIISGEDGSASLNFAVHYPGMDKKLNFSIYDLNTTTGEYKMIREGYKDQV